MYLKIQNCHLASVFTPTEERFSDSYLSMTDLLKGLQIFQSKKSRDRESMEDFFENFLIVIAK